jgi:hypothetical protein
MKRLRRFSREELKGFAANAWKTVKKAGPEFFYADLWKELQKPGPKFFYKKTKLPKEELLEKTVKLLRANTVFYFANLDKENSVTA